MLTGVTVRILTDIENRVAYLAAAGCSDDEVASELGVTATVAAAHVSRVFRKLGARSRAELAALLPPQGTAKEEE